MTMQVCFPRALFTLDEAQAATDSWGLNCGPSSLAVVTGKTLDEIRPHMGDFESKGYTNPTLMFQALRNVGAAWTCKTARLGERLDFPEYGLARVQWEGPWTKPGVPIRVRYRHTHWVGVCAEEGSEHNIFDVNCICDGGWVPLSEWSQNIVPWLLRECEPKADGRWHLTHAIEILNRVGGRNAD